jgi:hypothetical protein
LKKTLDCFVVCTLSHFDRFDSTSGAICDRFPRLVCSQNFLIAEKRLRSVVGANPAS